MCNYKSPRFEVMTYKSVGYAHTYCATLLGNILEKKK